MGGWVGGETHTLSSIVIQATKHLSGDQARRRNPTGHIGWERLRKERKVERYLPSPSLGLPECTEEVGVQRLGTGTLQTGLGLEQEVQVWSTWRRAG